jgi:hypothetical protein
MLSVETDWLYSAVLKRNGSKFFSEDSNPIVDISSGTSKALLIDSTEPSFLPAPLPSGKVEMVIRDLLRRASPWLAPSDTAEFTRHSVRHVLPTASAARDKPLEWQIEIRRWCGCSVYRQGLIAEQELKTKRALEIMTMPTRYSAEAATQRSIRIMKTEISVMREYISAVGVDSLPWFEGWDKLPRHNSKHV